MRMSTFRARIDAVLDQLFHDGARPFDYFAGGNLTGPRFREEADRLILLLIVDSDC